MGVTKKMLVGIKNGKQLRKGFVVPKPFFAEGEVDGFVSLETGAEVDRASIVYTGKSLSADDLISKYLRLMEAPGTEEELRDFFDGLLRKVKAAKLGSVVEVVPDDCEDGFRLQQIEGYSNRRSASRFAVHRLIRVVLSSAPAAPTRNNRPLAIPTSRPRERPRRERNLMT